MIGASATNAPVLRAKRLGKVYAAGDSAVHALRDIDLDIEDGELLVLLGPSGSGKSTLLNILGGLDRGTSGDAWFRETSLSAMNDRALTNFRRKHVGFIFQFYNLIPSVTARENVDLIREIADAPLSAEEALALVGLTDRMDHFPAQLSGGERCDGETVDGDAELPRGCVNRRAGAPRASLPAEHDTDVAARVSRARPDRDDPRRSAAGDLDALQIVGRPPPLWVE